MSDQYVRVPRELLERLELCVKEPEVGLLMQVRALLAAPAKDVRAVGEEPVGYAGLNGLKTLRGSDGYLIVSVKPERYLDIPLYRHPQRPVVLPFRRQLIESIDFHEGGSSSLENIAWNACIDEFERLNK